MGGKKSKRREGVRAQDPNVVDQRGPAQVLAKETGGGAPFADWQVANAAMTTDSFCSTYCHGRDAFEQPPAR
eukprot:gene10440-1073_t